MRTLVLVGMAGLLFGTVLAAGPNAEGKRDSQVVRNWLTGRIADGSLRARHAPPGLVRIVPETDVGILAVMTRDESGGYQPSDDPLSAYGRLRHRGDEVARHMDTIEPGIQLDSGVIRNPGPRRVSVVLHAGDEIRIEDLRPGDAIQVGQDVADILMSTHEVGCICTCEISGLSELSQPTITVNCCDSTTPPAQVSQCQCACHNSVACLAEERRGTIRDCAAGLVPDGGG